MFGTVFVACVSVWCGYNLFWLQYSVKINVLVCSTARRTSEATECDVFSLGSFLNQSGQNIACM
jgi:hypothetical protein